VSVDYKVGTASYCGGCTHSASRHTRNAGNRCLGRENYQDDCDCMRTRENVVAGAIVSGRVYDKKEISEKRSARYLEEIRKGVG